MERRRALAIAAATTTTTVGAIAAIAVNFGLLGFSAADSAPLGKLDAGRVAEVVDAGAGPSAAPTSGATATVRDENIYPPASAAAHPNGDVGVPTVHEQEQEVERETGHQEGHEDDD
jgi:hypothetical protein